MPVNDKIMSDQNFVNPFFYNEGVGRRTGWVQKKEARKDSDGFEIFDDYWSDSDQSSLSADSMMTLRKNKSMNKTKTPMRQSSPLRPMTSFAESEPSKSTITPGSKSQGSTLKAAQSMEDTNGSFLVGDTSNLPNSALQSFKTKKRLTYSTGKLKRKDAKNDVEECSMHEPVSLEVDVNHQNEKDHSSDNLDNTLVGDDVNEVVESVPNDCEKELTVGDTEVITGKIQFSSHRNIPIGKRNRSSVAARSINLTEDTHIIQGINGNDHVNSDIDFVSFKKKSVINSTEINFDDDTIEEDDDDFDIIEVNTTVFKQGIKKSKLPKSTNRKKASTGSESDSHKGNHSMRADSRKDRTRSSGNHSTLKEPITEKSVKTLGKTKNRMKNEKTEIEKWNNDADSEDKTQDKLERTETTSRKKKSKSSSSDDDVLQEQITKKPDKNVGKPRNITVTGIEKWDVEDSEEELSSSLPIKATRKKNNEKTSSSNKSKSGSSGENTSNVDRPKKTRGKQKKTEASSRKKSNTSLDDDVLQEELTKKSVKSVKITRNKKVTGMKRWHNSEEELSRSSHIEVTRQNNKRKTPSDKSESDSSEDKTSNVERPNVTRGKQERAETNRRKKSNTSSDDVLQEEITEKSFKNAGKTTKNASVRNETVTPMEKWNEDEDSDVEELPIKATRQKNTRKKSRKKGSKSESGNSEENTSIVEKSDDEVLQTDEIEKSVKNIRKTRKNRTIAEMEKWADSWDNEEELSSNLLIRKNKDKNSFGNKGSQSESGSNEEKLSNTVRSKKTQGKQKRTKTSRKKKSNTSSDEGKPETHKIKSPGFEDCNANGEMDDKIESDNGENKVEETGRMLEFLHEENDFLPLKADNDSSSSDNRETEDLVNDSEVDVMPTSLRSKRSSRRYAKSEQFQKNDGGFIENKRLNKTSNCTKELIELEKSPGKTSEDNLVKDSVVNLPTSLKWKRRSRRNAKSEQFQKTHTGLIENKRLNKTSIGTKETTKEINTDSGEISKDKPEVLVEDNDLVIDNHEASKKNVVQINSKTRMSRNRKCYSEQFEQLYTEVIENERLNKTTNEIGTMSGKIKRSRRIIGESVEDERGKGVSEPAKKGRGKKRSKSLYNPENALFDEHHNDSKTNQSDIPDMTVNSASLNESRPVTQNKKSHRKSTVRFSLGEGLSSESIVTSAKVKPQKSILKSPRPPKVIKIDSDVEDNFDQLSGGDLNESDDPVEEFESGGLPSAQRSDGEQNEMSDEIHGMERAHTSPTTNKIRKTPTSRNNSRKKPRSLRTEESVISKQSGLGNQTDVLAYSQFGDEEAWKETNDEEARSADTLSTYNQSVPEETFSNLPYPANRTLKCFEVPRKKAYIIDPEVSESGVRRTKRHRVKPLQYWRNERPIYERRKSGGFALSGIQSPTIPTPSPPIVKEKRKVKRKIPQTPRNLSVHMDLSDLSDVEFQEEINPTVTVINPNTNEEVGIDAIKTSEMNYFFGPTGKPAVATDPIAMSKCLYQKSFSAGQLLIRPLQEKGIQVVRTDTMVFRILCGKLAVTIHQTTNILESGAMFFIPQGNVYNIKNLRNDEAKLLFVQVKSH